MGSSEQYHTTPEVSLLECIMTPPSPRTNHSVILNVYNSNADENFDNLKYSINISHAW